ncbi:MAG: ferritin-like domain-containing protein [Terriglobia bacterium]
MKIGKSVLEMAGTDQEAEVAAVRSYNASIRLGHEVEDQASADLLTKILKMEEGHVDWAEQQRAQIEQIRRSSVETHLLNCRRAVRKPAYLATVFRAILESGLAESLGPMIPGRHLFQMTRLGPLS